jgi:hypothetical protein
MKKVPTVRKEVSTSHIISGGWQGFPHYDKKIMVYLSAEAPLILEPAQ